MPRFSVGFGRRKSTAAEDVFQNVEVASNEPSSFRVPSERSNIGLPGRYRPVSHAPQVPAHGQSQGSVYDFQSNPARTSTMSGAISGWDQTTMKALQGKTPSPPLPKTSTLRKVEDDDDDDEGWEAMKAKREKKRSMWRSKKSIGSELGAFIS
ncbi:hypothetical protein BN1723_018888, partial [Verticillium longisporum]